MAILGFQVVSSLIMVSVLSKMSSHFSFGKFFLARHLARYIHPTDDELREAAGLTGKGRGDRNTRRRKNDGLANGQQETFTIPKSTAFGLDVVKIRPHELLPLHFFSDYQWLMDFSLCSAVVYALNEFVYGLIYGGAYSRLNLSLLWCLLSLFFALRVLALLAKMYFKAGMAQNSESGEAMLTLTAGFFFLVLAMAVLILPSSQLQIDFDDAYATFSRAARSFLANSTTEAGPNDGPIALLSVRALLAGLAAFLGALLTFPGFRYAKMYVDALRYCGDHFSLTNTLRRAALHVAFFAPLLSVLLWLTPVARELRFLTPGQVASLRLLLPLALCLLRLCLTRTHLQAYLNLAHVRTLAIRKEAGRVSNVEIQKTIARIYYYLCVVALQYLAPLLLLLMFAFLLKTLGAYSWDPELIEPRLPEFMKAAIKSAAAPRRPTNISSVPDLLSRLFGVDKDYLGVDDAVRDWTTSMQSLKDVFTPIVYRCILGFLVFWVQLVMLLTSLCGLLYHSYLS